MTAVPNPQKDQRTRKYGWTTLPAQGREGPPPPLSTAVSDRAGALWVEWWGTPMALMWADHDRHALERLLALYQAAWDGQTTATVLSEIRQLEDKYGLTPAARRKLFWQIEGLEAESTEVEQSSRVVPSTGGDTDPRKLRAV